MSVRWSSNVGSVTLNSVSTDPGLAQESFIDCERAGEGSETLHLVFPLVVSHSTQITWYP